jgi:hypothetical protein
MINSNYDKGFTDKRGNVINVTVTPFGLIYLFPKNLFILFGALGAHYFLAGKTCAFFKISE